MPIGERIKALRSEQRWSQGDLATKIGADPGQISRYENGHIAPRPTPSSAWPRRST